MKRQWAAAAVFAGLSVCSAVQANTQKFYCAEADKIIFTPQSVPWAAYRYDAPKTPMYDGLQPALMGEGNAHQTIQMHSAVWTDGALSCNYDGLTDNQQKETMVMTSEPLSTSDSYHCQFPTNGGKSYCNSNNPADCYMICE